MHSFPVFCFTIFIDNFWEKRLKECTYWPNEELIKPFYDN